MLLYHESQKDALCGVHALNALAQGPLFDALGLAQVARELDQQELALLGGGAGGGRPAGEHGHVDASGNFSSAVLDRALGGWGLSLVRRRARLSRAGAVAGAGAGAGAGGDGATATDSAAPADPPPAVAYLLNQSEHWLTVRRMGDTSKKGGGFPSGVGRTLNGAAAAAPANPPPGAAAAEPAGRWFNFNSLLPAPQSLSDFYLAAFLDSLEQQQYTVFEVRVVAGADGQGGGGGGVGDAAHDASSASFKATEEALARMQEAAAAAAATSHGVGDASDGRWFTPEQADEAKAEQAAAHRRGRAMHAVEGAFARAEAAGGGGFTLRPRRAAAAAATARNAGLDEDDDEDEGGGGRGAAAIGGGGGGRDDDDDPELAAVLAMSAAEARQAGGGGAAVDPAADQAPLDDGGDDDDPGLAAALAASLADAAPPPPPLPPPRPRPPPAPLPDEPAEGEPALRLALRLPSGARVERRFAPGGSVGDLYAFAAHHAAGGEQQQQQGGAGAGGATRSVVLRTLLPPRRVLERGQSLAEAGLEDRSVVVVALE